MTAYILLFLILFGPQYIFLNFLKLVIITLLNNKFEIKNIASCTVHLIDLPFQYIDSGVSIRVNFQFEQFDPNHF
jgi:hypothetical protein